MKINRIVLFSVLGILLIGGVYWFLNIPKNPEKPGIASLLEVIKKRELHLVQYNYLDMVFLYKKDNPNKKLRMIVKYPVNVSAAVDLKLINVDSVNKKIIFPAPFLKEPEIFIDKAEFTKVRDGFMITFGGSRLKILETLRSRANESKERLKNDAKRLGILEQAEDEALAFIEDFIPSFTDDKYTVTFMEPEEAILKEISLEGDALYLIEISDEIDAIIDEN